MDTCKAINVENSSGLKLCVDLPVANYTQPSENAAKDAMTLSSKSWAEVAEAEEDHKRSIQAKAAKKIIKKHHGYSHPTRSCL